jgi:hypothetical protein
MGKAVHGMADDLSYATASGLEGVQSAARCGNPLQGAALSHQQN